TERNAHSLRLSGDMVAANRLGIWFAPWMARRGIVMSSRVLWEEDLHSGSHWSGVIRRGTTLRLTDVDGGANVGALFYNYEDRLERYNMADTLMGQHPAYPT